MGITISPTDLLVIMNLGFFVFQLTTYYFYLTRDKKDVAAQKEKAAAVIVANSRLVEELKSLTSALSKTLQKPKPKKPVEGCRYNPEEIKID